MQGALPAPTERSLAGNSLFARYGLYGGAVVAALIGLLVLPAVFHALADHDIQISNRVSVFDVIWLVLGAALSVYLIGMRGKILNPLSRVIREHLEDLERQTAEGDSGPSRTTLGPPQSDLSAAGSTTLARLFDIVFLLVIQAIVREPLVGVLKAFAPEAVIDGLYVVVVVAIALVLLMNVRAVSRPLLDYLLWLGLDAAVPTAGFVTSNASETFTRITSTSTTTRSDSGPRSQRSARSTPAPTGEPTIAAPDALMPTMLEGSVEATVAAPQAIEATVVAPSSGDETAFAPAPAVEATVMDTPETRDDAVDATRVASDADQTIVSPSDQALERKTGPNGRSEGER